MDFVAANRPKFRNMVEQRVSKGHQPTIDVLKMVALDPVLEWHKRTDALDLYLRPKTKNSELFHKRRVVLQCLKDENPNVQFAAVVALTSGYVNITSSIKKQLRKMRAEAKEPTDYLISCLSTYFG